MKTSRRAFLVCAFLALAAIMPDARAQIAPTIHYQGHLTTAAGQPVTAMATIVVRLYDAPAGGMPLFQETHAVQVTNGLYGLSIGSITPLNASLFAGPRYVSIQVGTDPEMTPRQPLAASPYAFRAESLSPSATISAAQITGSVASCSAGDLLPCYTGPAGTLGVGACKAGYRACNPMTGTFGVCTGAVLPSAEVIDGVDNNCNGLIDEDLAAPTINSPSPANLATGVFSNVVVTVPFSEAMNPATITNASFTITGPGGPVAGSVGYSNNSATFTPSTPLAPSTTYTATITTAAKDASGNPLAAPFSFSFTTGNAPSATIVQPSGIGHFAIPVRYSISDSGSNAASILAEFSVNGGSSWSPATRLAAASFPEGTSDLATSPAGTPHVFLWSAAADGVGTSGLVGTVRFRVTPTTAATGTSAETVNFAVNNNSDQVIGVATTTFPRDGKIERIGEVALGNLVADAMRAAAGTQFFMHNGGGLRASLPSPFVPANTSLRRPGAGFAAGPPYDLVLADVYSVLPFANEIVTRTVTGAQLWQALEHSVSFLPNANGGFMQISGLRFTYRLANPAGTRVQAVTFPGGAPIPADGTVYTLGLNEFNAAGGDGYTMFADGQGTHTLRIEADVLLDYIQILGTITPSTDGRISAVP